jgi:hypothetical protein
MLSVLSEAPSNPEVHELPQLWKSLPHVRSATHAVYSEQQLFATQTVQSFTERSDEQAFTLIAAHTPLSAPWSQTQARSGPQVVPEAHAR